MIKNSHEQDVIELTGNRIHVIDRALGKFNVQAQNLGGKTGLIEVAVVHVNAQNAAGAPLLEFNGMKSAVAADIKHTGAGQIRGQRRSNVLPLYVGKIAQKMMRRRPNSVQVDVVEPVTFFFNTTY